MGKYFDPLTGRFEDDDLDCRPYKPLLPERVVFPITTPEPYDDPLSVRGRYEDDDLGCRPYEPLLPCCPPLSARGRYEDDDLGCRPYEPPLLAPVEFPIRTREPDYPPVNNSGRTEEEERRYQIGHHIIAYEGG